MSNFIGLFWIELNVSGGVKGFKGQILAGMSKIEAYCENVIEKFLESFFL